MKSQFWCLSIVICFLLSGTAQARIEPEVVTAMQNSGKTSEFGEDGEAGKDDADEEKEDGVLERPTLRASLLSPDFRFDGTDGPIWAAAVDSIANLTMIEPVEGGVPSGRTSIKIFANRNDIVVCARCYDAESDGIVSFSKERDSELEEEDHLVIIFDTFLDGRSGYVFVVNPSGARFDGLVIEQGEDVNGDWDTIWDAKTSRDGTGWYAEIRIPVKSLVFKKNLNTWGFNVQRRVQRLQESSRWSGANLDYEIYQTSRAGLLTGLPGFELGRGLSIRPSLVGRTGKSASGADTDSDGELSLDVTQRVGPNLLSALTVNTDFAETEVDVRQINLTRFPLFFPEKRTFFLEGSDIFEFGVGLDEEKLVPFFSRRIGLLGLGEEDQAEIPINAGGKINGRVGNTNLGALVVNTREVDSLPVDEGSKVHVPRATMGVVRIRQNVLEESALGMIATSGDQQGRSGSWSAGVDFTYRTSGFLGDKNFIVGIWGLLNDREDLSGDKSAYGLKIDYPNDLLSINLNSIRLGDGFDPSLGFMPRNNLHIWELSAEYKPRPSWTLVRQMFHDLTVTLYNNRNNSRWESYDATIKPLDWLLESGDQFEAVILLQGDRPPEDFEISDDAEIPPGTYEWTRYILGVSSAEKRKISGEIAWESGNYYNGDLNTIEASLAVKPSALFSLEFTAERNTGKAMALVEDFEELTPTEFTEELFGLRWQLNFSSDLYLSSLTQYDTESRELGTNNKLRWTFHPSGEIFVVYNHNMTRIGDRWEFISNQLPVKVQYVWRF